MSRHFCCCIPVRVAVFISSLLGFIFSTLISGVGVFVLLKIKDDDPRFGNLTKEQKIVTLVLTIVYALVALISLFGFVGSVLRKRGLVALYSTMTIVAFLVQTAADAYVVYSLFHGGGARVCTTLGGEECSDVLRGPARGITVALLVLVWLIQLYIVVVIRRYATQLAEEQRASAFTMAPAKGPNYQPLHLGHDHAPYAYADPHNAFGKHA